MSSDYTSLGPAQTFKSQAFAAALQRAKQIAAKINPGSTNTAAEPLVAKRPLDDPIESEAKKMASSPQGGRPGMVSPLSSSGSVLTEDIKVPDKMVGLIIGRGGEQITRLQSESGCKIQMAPDSGGAPDRICTLTGSPQAISRAKELVNAIVHQRYKTEGPSNNSPDLLIPQQPQPTQHSGNPSFVEIMLPGPKVGLVIGKGGETIKQLQEKSGAKMVVIQDGPNPEAEKPLRITGDPQKVEYAKALVYELLAEKENQSRGQQGRGGGGNRGGGFGGGGGRFGNRGGEESTFVVPANKCGVIIGRGGETIKQINQATGAHCELDRRPNNNPNEKVFIIRGSMEQIESAKSMIQEKLGGGGGGGGGGGPVGGGGGGFPPQNQWGAPSQQSYQPSYQQPDPSSGLGMGGGLGGLGTPPAPAPQPDYSQQWIEYYRSLGMHQEADAIEQQAKAKAAAASGGGGGAPGGGGGPGGAPGGLGQPQQNGSVVPGGGGGQGGAPDYSAQWAQYYRNIGKIKEAEMIEEQMKSKQTSAPAPGGNAGGGPGGFPSYYPGGGPGGFYPPQYSGPPAGAYPPYPGPPQPPDGQNQQ